MKPPPRLTVSQWSDTERILPVGSPNPGKWRTERAEYQREIMDAFNDPAVERIVVMTSSQVGKTEILNNICGYFIHHDANGPVLVLQPTLEMARAWSTDRLAPLIETTKALKDLIGDPKSKDGDNTILQKIFFNGARLTISGSNSPASLASRPIRVLLMDEIDRFPPSAGTEGDPVSLGIRRTQNYFNRKIAMFSTPTIKGASRIEAAFEQSDQRFFELQCDCGHWQALKWSHVQWDEDRPETARIICEECETAWTDIERKQKIKNGRWNATADFHGIAGFSLNALSSPWTSLEGLVREFLEAKAHGTESLRVFINTALGETWEEDAVDIDEHDLFSRIEKYDDEIPHGDISVLTAGVDVQSDRIECLVCGHGHLDELWMLDLAIFYGAPTGEKVWNDLAIYLRRGWKHPSGNDLRIIRTFIDSGYEPDRVYKFAQVMGGNGVWIGKGVGGSDRPIVGRPSKNNASRVNVFPLGVNTIKQILFTRLRNSEIGPGYFHIGDFADDEFVRQLTSEKLVTRYSRGIPRTEFKKIRTRNEALDLLVYNLAAFHTLNADTRKIAYKLSEVRREKPMQPRRRKNFVTKW